MTIYDFYSNCNNRTSISHISESFLEESFRCDLYFSHNVSLQLLVFQCQDNPIGHSIDIIVLDGDTNESSRRKKQMIPKVLLVLEKLWTSIYRPIFLTCVSPHTSKMMQVVKHFQIMMPGFHLKLVIICYPSTSYMQILLLYNMFLKILRGDIDNRKSTSGYVFKIGATAFS